MAIKRTRIDSITVPTLTYDTPTWNEAEGFPIQAVKVSYLRGACGLNRMNGESNKKSVHKISCVLKLWNELGCG